MAPRDTYLGDMGFLDFDSGGGALLPVRGARGTDAVLRWSDRRTWHGRLPSASDVVRVPAGSTLLIDTNIAVAAIIVLGTLEFAACNLNVRTAGLLVLGDGRVRAGTAEQPFTHRLVVTLIESGEHSLVDGLGSRFIAAIGGGTIELYGPRRMSWSMLGDTVFPGGVVVRLAEPVDWRAGEHIVVASGGADLPLVEERAVAAIANDRRRITLDRPLCHRHLGRTAPVAGSSPQSIGKVALLSRDIVIEGDDASCAASQGAHCLISARLPGEATASARHAVGRFSGVEFRRVGQFNMPGRYPLHWLANGESADNALLDCSVHDSYQRGVVVTNTHGVRMQGNVVYRPLGHGFVVEHADDGAALLATNLAIRPRVVRYADPAMRSLGEHNPRAVWAAQAVQPRTVGQVAIR